MDASLAKSPVTSESQVPYQGVSGGRGGGHKQWAWGRETTLRPTDSRNDLSRSLRCATKPSSSTTKKKPSTSTSPTRKSRPLPPQWRCPTPTRLPPTTAAAVEREAEGNKK